MSQWRLALWGVGGVAYAIASHWMMLYHATAPWALAALFAPLLLAVLGFAASRFGFWGGACALVLGGLVIAAVSRGNAVNPNHLYVLQHVSFNAFFCAWFGSTLRPGRPSLIGAFAQRVHPMSPDMWTYTANVTRVWTAYFALMVVASIVVYLLLPFSAWSLLANVLTPLFVVMLFLGEHFARYRLHPEFERSRLVDVVRAAMGTRSKRAAGR